MMQTFQEEISLVSCTYQQQDLAKVQLSATRLTLLTILVVVRYITHALLAKWCTCFCCVSHQQDAPVVLLSMDGPTSRTRSS